MSMDDLTMMRLTAAAMGYEFNDGDADCLMVVPTVADMKAAAAPFPIERTVYSWFRWNPLEDDAQAMALVKEMALDIYWLNGGLKWRVECFTHKDISVHNYDINRAIVECVAKMQQAKTK